MHAPTWPAGGGTDIAGTGEYVLIEQLLLEQLGILLSDNSW